MLAAEQLPAEWPRPSVAAAFALGHSTSEGRAASKEAPGGHDARPVPLRRSPHRERDPGRPGTVMEVDVDDVAGSACAICGATTPTVPAAVTVPDFAVAV